MCECEGWFVAKVLNYQQAGFDTLSESLAWRGLMSQSTDVEALKKALDQEHITFYCGFDPTASSLHVGNLVSLIVMRHLQEAGHQPLALVGGTTGLIGDPRQSGERKLNPKDIVAGWVERLKIQIAGILRTQGDQAVQFVNNYDWTSSMSVVDFLRDIGKNFRMGSMLSKEIVAKRLESEEGLSFAEFSYQVLQGYDFLHLFDQYQCVLQIGGSDQWGNLTSGLDLIRKVRDEQVHVFTTPLITDGQGRKFGKSEGNALWIDSSMLSVYRFYQFWINQPDDQVEKLLKVFTFLPKARIEELVEQVKEDPGARLAQKTLAWEVTSFVHGEESTKRVIEASEALFGKGLSLEDVSEDSLADVLDALKVTDDEGNRQFAKASTGERVIEAAVRAGLFTSLSQGRKTVQSGGVYINNCRVENEDQLLKEDDYLHGRFIVLRRGKKALAALERA